MLAVPVVAMLHQPKHVAPTAIPVRAPGLTPPPFSSTPSPPAVDERFSALQAQGLEQAQQGALPEAARLLQKALDLRPTDAETWNSLGVVLVRQGETALGARAFSRALGLDANHSEAQLNLAVTLDRQGRAGEAVTHYQAFLRLTREDHPARDDVRRRLAEMSASVSGSKAGE